MISEMINFAFFKNLILCFLRITIYLNLKFYRTIFIQDKLKLYENYWDFTQNSEFDDEKLINNCLRTQDYGLSNISF